MSDHMTAKTMSMDELSPTECWKSHWTISRFFNFKIAIYFILKISSCKVCPKTYPPNTRLKLHIGRYQEVLELIGDVFLMELFWKNPNFCPFSPIDYCLISKVLFLWGEYDRISFESVSMLNHCHESARSTDIVIIIL